MGPIINIMYDFSISDFEKRALKVGAGELLNVLPEVSIRLRGTTSWCEKGIYFSPVNFIASSKRIWHSFREYVDVDDLVKRMESHSRNVEKQIFILFTAEELAHRQNARMIQKTYGANYHCVSVQSVAPYRMLCTTADDIMLLTKMALFSEVGRLLGALKRKGNPIVSFCDDDDCAMGQAWTFHEMLPLARRLNETHRVFCPECLKAIRARLSSNPGPS